MVNFNIFKLELNTIIFTCSSDSYRQSECMHSDYYEIIMHIVVQCIAVLAANITNDSHMELEEQ